MTPEEEEKRLMEIASISKKFGLSEDDASKVYDSSTGTRGAVRTFASNLAKNSTFGLSDLAQSGIYSLRSGKSLKDARKFVDAANKEGDALNPLASSLGGGSGFAAGMALPAGFVSRGIQGATKMAPWAANVIGSGLEAGAMGAAGGAAESIGRDESMADLAGKGAAYGTGFGAGLPLAGKAVSKVLPFAGVISGKRPSIVKELYATMGRKDPGELIDIKRKLGGDLANIHEGILAGGVEKQNLLAGKSMDPDEVIDIVKRNYDQKIQQTIPMNLKNELASARDSIIGGIKQDHYREVPQPQSSSQWGGESYAGAPKSPQIEKIPIPASKVDELMPDLDAASGVANNSPTRAPKIKRAASDTRTEVSGEMKDFIPGLREHKQGQAEKLSDLESLGVSAERKYNPLTQQMEFSYSEPQIHTLVERLAKGKERASDMANLNRLADSSRVEGVGDVAQNARDAFLRNDFSWGAPRGSRGTMMGAKLGEAMSKQSIPGGKALGAAVGYGMDYLASPVTKAAAGALAKADKLSAPYRERLVAAASRSPASLLIAHNALLKDKNYVNELQSTGGDTASNLPNDLQGGGAAVELPKDLVK